MAPPKHLWSGDWQRESAEAAAARRQGRPEGEPWAADEPATEREAGSRERSGPATGARPVPGEAGPAPRAAASARTPTPVRANGQGWGAQTDRAAPPSPSRRTPGPGFRVRLRQLRSWLQGHARPRRDHLRVLAIALALMLVVAVGAFALQRAIHPGPLPVAGTNSAEAWLGAELGVSPSGAVLVLDVHPGSPAAGADVRSGDVITEVQGRPVAAPVDVQEAINALRPGDSVELQLLRGSSTDIKQVKLGGKPASAGP